MDQLISEKQILVGLSELHLVGLIEFRGEDEVKLTDKGVDYAWDLFHSHTSKEMLALVLLQDRVAQIVE